MKIDIAKLKNAKRKQDGSIVAQCPACAAAGGDSTGNHLIVYPDGKFGCVVNQVNMKHNKEIWKLVGGGEDQPVKRPKVKIRPYKIEPSKVIGLVPRRTLEELGLIRDPKKETRLNRPGG